MEEKEQETNIDETKKRKKAIDELKKATKEFNKEQEKEEKQTKANTSAIKNAKDALKDFNSRITDTADAFKILYLKDMVLTGGIIGLGSKLIEAATKMLTFNSELHRTVINAGKGTAGVEAYSKTVVNLGKSMGATQEDTQKIVKTLAELQYLGTAKEIERASEASYGLARAFNINHEEVAQNTVELQKWGQVSAETTTAMYADLMKVAQANGLTKNGVKAIMKTTTEWSGMLKAFGKTAPVDVQRYNMSLAKTVSALEKVGVSAQTSTKLLEDLTDPTKIEANIPAYAAFGISITDAISGNIDPEKMGAGLKEFGEKLKQMGPIAGAQYAEAMGVSYKDAIKAASADMAEASQVDMTPEEKSAEAMKQLTETTKDTTEKIQDVFTKIGSTFRSFGPLIMIVGGTLINFLKKRKKEANDENLKNTEENIKKEKKTKIEAIQEEIDFLTKKQEEANDKNRMLNALMAQEQALEDVKLHKDKLIRNRLLFEELATNSKSSEEEIKKIINNRINSQLLSEKEAQEEICQQKLAEIKEISRKETDLKEELAKAVSDEKKEQLRRDINNLEILKKETIEKKVNAANKIKEVEKKLASKEITDEVNELAKKYRKLGKSTSVNIGRFIGDALDKVSKKPLKIATKIKGSTLGVKIGKGLIDAGEAVKDKLSKIKIGIKQASGSGPGKMLKALGGIGKSLGIMGIVMAIISKALTKIGDPFESLIDNLVDIFIPIIKALLPSLTSILTVLVKTLLPPMLRILSMLMKILSVTIVPVLGFLLRALSHFPGLTFLREVADGISEAFGPKTQKAIEEAADAASNLSAETKENTEETKKSNENKKEQLQVGKSGRVTVTKAQHKDEETDTKETKKETNSSQAVVNNTNTKTETTKETNSSQTVANNVNTNAQTVAIKETNKELSEIKILMGQFMSKLSEIIDKNNNSIEMARAVEDGFKRVCQNVIPVRVEELPPSVPKDGKWLFGRTP